MKKNNMTVGETTTNESINAFEKWQVINKAKLDAWQTLAERMIEESAHNRTSDRMNADDDWDDIEIFIMENAVNVIFNIMSGKYDDMSVLKDDVDFQDFLSFNGFEYGKILVEWLTNQIGVDEELAEEMAIDAFGKEEED